MHHHHPHPHPSLCATGMDPRDLNMLGTCSSQLSYIPIIHQNQPTWASQLQLTWCLCIPILSVQTPRCSCGLNSVWQVQGFANQQNGTEKIHRLPLECPSLKQHRAFALGGQGKKTSIFNLSSCPRSHTDTDIPWNLQINIPPMLTGWRDKTPKPSPSVCMAC